MDVALAVSGTVGLELAALEVPHVIGYRASPLTAMMVRRLIKVKYAHLANIMEDRQIVPEFIQENCGAERIAAAATELLSSPEAQKAAFQDVKFRLGFGQELTPSQKAAAFLLSL